MEMMFRSIIVAFALALAACGVPVASQAQLQQAKGVSLGLEGAYVIALQAATTWADKKNRCGPASLPPPACSTAQGVLDVEAKRILARSALTRLDAVIADATATPDMLSVAMSAAQNAVGAYQDFSKGAKP